MYYVHDRNAVENSSSSTNNTSGTLSATSLFHQVLGGGHLSSSSALSLDDALALSSSSVFADNVSPGVEQKKVMLVVLLGGVSYLELSAFRFLSADPQFPFRIVVATTKVMNGSTLLESLHQRS
jgi:hypothetical protein